MNAFRRTALRLAAAKAPSQPQLRSFVPGLAAQPWQAQKPAQHTRLALSTVHRRFASDEPRVGETVSTAPVDAEVEAKHEAAQTLAAEEMPSRPASSPDNKVLYCGNLFFDATTQELESHCSRYGRVVSCRIVKDARGMNKG